MKATALFFAFLMLAMLGATAVSYAEKADDILGEWYSENNESLVEMYKNNGKFYGKITWLKEPLRRGQPKMDDENPDEKLRNRPIIGMVILKDFVFDGDNEWKDGKIYDPKSGKTYSCYMKFEKKDVLKIRGYIGISLLGRTTMWTRKK
jgi:uncharacterized protein (DUF2147 family)